MMSRRLAVTGCALVLAAVGAPVAGAHVKTDAGNWLFTGSTYSGDSDRSKPPNRENRSDPVSVIWRGPTGATATIARAEDHTEQHWRDRRIPDRYPNGAFMRPRNNSTNERVCRDAQLVWYRDGNDANHGGWAQSRGYMSTNGLCANQYHLRMYSSALHAQLFGSNHASEWVLAPIHHEHVEISVDWPPQRHVIDLPWDQSRSVYMHTMGAVHCIERDWAVHPESQDAQYGDIRVPYSGIISRISFRHKSEGCDGA
jgi:hypothetical protein